MSPHGRLRAPFLMIIAACLGFSVLTAAPASASTPTPAVAVSSGAVAAAASGAAGGASHAVVASATPAGQPGLDRRAVDALPADSPLQKLAGDQPDYVPAGCNVADPKPGEASCFAFVATSKTHVFAPDTTGPPSTAVTPAQLRSAYDLPDGGAGETVAIVDAFGDANAESDLAAFRAEYGMPACTTANGCFRKVDENGGTDYPVNDPGWGLETSLDLDAVSSVCPLCDILLVQADTNSTADLGTAENTAVSLGAKFVSNSYGSGDNASEVADTDYDHPGVVVAAGSGDTGNVVSWPGADPNVVSVGGTTLTADPGSARGWDETAWDSGGSGCSGFEPQPAYQADLTTDCTNRAISDLSADADPSSGLAVYDTLGQSGWVQVGGTSLATPLVTAMYALAGTPVPGTYPVTYPYAYGGNHLFDVTQGSDGSCGNVLCTAGSGWDGPTGLGTPDGVQALTEPSLGTALGTITAASGGSPLAGAGVTLTDAAQGLTFTATTDAQGRYSANAAAGTYTATFSDFGYKDTSVAGIVITAGRKSTENATLTSVPSRTLSGTVTDGSGHGWPLYAAITVAGDPLGAVYTNPKTGVYAVQVPEQSTAALYVTPVYPGYEPAAATIAVGSANVKHDFAIDADETGCTAPGYAYPAQADFEGWATPAENGWTAGDAVGTTAGWGIENPATTGVNLTGGTGEYAAADPFMNGGAAEDTDMVTPVMDLRHQPGASLRFDTAYLPAANSVAEVDLSTDGGTTWSSIWDAGTDVLLGPVTVPLTAADGKANARLRFHVSGSGQTIWEVDDVTVGSCALQTGGLVEGVVIDANTRQPVNGAVVTDASRPLTTATSAATPADPNLSDGFYWLFSQGVGRHTYSIGANRYTTLRNTASTVSNAVVQNDLTLQAGDLVVSPPSVSMEEPLGGRGSRQVTLTNKGRAPLHVSLGEQDVGSTAGGSATAAAAQSVPLEQVPGDFPVGPATGAKAQGPATMRKSASSSVAGSAAAHASQSTAPTAGGAWQATAAYPEPIMDNAVGYYEGKIYSVGGVQQIINGVAVADAYVYDPASATWSAFAPLPQPLEAPTAAFLDGTMYVAGGWNNEGVEQSTLYAYHPSSDTWAQVADLPQGAASGSTAVLDGSLYVIGGCTQECSALLNTVYRYSPSSNVWTAVAHYPVTVQWLSCAGVVDEVVCAGGDTWDAAGNVESLASTYIYHPRQNTWTQGADMPNADWGMASSGANGELQVVGGIISGPDIVGGIADTNQAEQFDPAHDVWSALPDALFPIFRGGGAGCGMSQIGGSTGAGLLQFPSGNTVTEVLPGFDQCGGDQVPWLSTDRRSLELAPGQSVRVRVTADAAQLEAPGDYAAELTFTTDTPYAQRPVTVKLDAAAPSSWGEISGTVTAAGSGAPLAGATVRICAAQDAKARQCRHPLYSTTTDSQGSYAVWLPGHGAPLVVSASIAGYRAQIQEVAEKPGGDSVAAFMLTTVS